MSLKRKASGLTNVAQRNPLRASTPFLLSTKMPLPREILTKISDKEPFLNLSNLNKTMQRIYRTKNPLNILDDWLRNRLQNDLKRNSPLEVLVYYQLVFQEQFSVENHHSSGIFDRDRRELIYVKDIPAKFLVTKFLALKQAETLAILETLSNPKRVTSATSAAVLTPEKEILEAKQNNINAEQLFSYWTTYYANFSWVEFLKYFRRFKFFETREIKQGNTTKIETSFDKLFFQNTDIEGPKTFIQNLNKIYPDFNKFIITQLYNWYKINYVQSVDLANFIKAVPNTFVFSRVFNSFQTIDWSLFFQTGELKTLGDKHKILYLPGPDQARNIFYLGEAEYSVVGTNVSVPSSYIELLNKKVIFLDRFLHTKPNILKHDVSKFVNHETLNTWKVIDDQKFSPEELEKFTIINDRYRPTVESNFNVFGSKFVDEKTQAYFVTDWNLEYEVLLFTRFVRDRYNQATMPLLGVLNPAEVTMAYNYTLDPEVLLRLSILLQKLKNVMNLKMEMEMEMKTETKKEIVVGDDDADNDDI